MSYRNRTSTDMRSQDTSIKYHGLRNQGSTCYLNSVLQVMYMTKDFREAVKSHCDETPETPPIDVQLNTLFDGLKTSVEQTRAITRRLGIEHVYKQQDAAEYYEKILRMTRPEASQIFHGQLTHRTTCAGCQTSSDADAFFWNIHLAMPDRHALYDVKDGFDMFFRPVIVNGDNQMYCHTCDSKENATIACELKEQPEVLVLLLKRFDFDYQYMTHVKINSCVDIPDTLHTPQKQAYELYAIVDQYGDLQGGHYSSRIKSLDDDDHGRWYRFDDARVTEVDSHQIKTETQRSRSAYLLFYRKQQMHSLSAQKTNRPAEDQRPISDHAEMDNDKLRKRKSQWADLDDVGDAKQSKTTHSVEHEVKPETPNEIQRPEEGDLFKTGPVEKHQHTGRFQSLRSKSGEAKQDIEERAHTLTRHGEVREDTERGGVEGDGIVGQATERSHEEGEKRIVQGDVQRTSGESTVGREQSGPETPSKVPLAETEKNGREETPKHKKEKQRKTQGEKEKTFGDSTVVVEQSTPETPSKVVLLAKTERSRTEREKNGREETLKYKFEGEDESQQTDQCEPPSGFDEKHATENGGDKSYAERRVRQNQLSAQQVDRRYPEVNNSFDSNGHTEKQASNNEKQRKTQGDEETTFGDSTVVVEQSTPETPSEVVLLAKTERSRSEREKHGRGKTPKDTFEVVDEFKQRDQCEENHSRSMMRKKTVDRTDVERKVRQNQLSVQQVDRPEDSNTSQFTADVAKVTDPCEAVDDCTGLGQGSKNSGSKKGKHHYPEVNNLETLGSNAHTAKHDRKKHKKETQRKTQGDEEKTFGDSTLVVEQSTPETPSKVVLAKTDGSRSEREKDGRGEMPKHKKEKQRKTQGDEEKTFGDSSERGEQCRTERSSQVGVVKTREGSRAERQIPAHQVDGQEESNTPFLNRQRSPIEITECEDDAPTGLPILDGSLTPSRGSVTSKRKNKFGCCFKCFNPFKNRSKKKIGIYSGKKTKSK